MDGPARSCARAEAGSPRSSRMQRPATRSALFVLAHEGGSMRTVAVASVLALALVASPLPAAEQEAAAHATFRALELKIMTAVRENDVGTLDTLLSPGFAWAIAFEGRPHEVMNRSEWLAWGQAHQAQQLRHQRPGGGEVRPHHPGELPSERVREARRVRSGGRSLRGHRPVAEGRQGVEAPAALPQLPGAAAHHALAFGVAGGE